MQEQPRDINNYYPQAANRPNGNSYDNSNVPKGDNDDDDHEGEEEEHGGSGTMILIVLLAVLVAGGVVAGAVCGTGHCSASSNSGSTSGSNGGDATLAPTAAPVLSTLKNVHDKGTLVCGVLDGPYESSYNETTGQYQGFSVDLCRAVAAAVFGGDDPSHYTLKTMTSLERFFYLNSGDVDLLVTSTTHTMERDLMESTTGVGFTFSIPYLYDGLSFAGISEFVACADAMNVTGVCADSRICLLAGTTHDDILTADFSDAVLVRVPDNDEMYNNFIRGICNVIAGESLDIAEPLVRAKGWTGEYVHGYEVLSKEPLAFVTREDDPNWSDFVNWILEGLLAAEEAGIEQKDAESMLPQTDVFGPDYARMFIDAISAVGNYGEMFTRHFTGVIPRQGANQLNRGVAGPNVTSGLIYSHPFGNSEATLQQEKNGTLNEIRLRGELRCGIARREGFAEFDTNTQEWSGLDVDCCKALSAAIFNGVTNTVQYFDLAATDRFVSLERGDVDVLARITTHNFERDVKEPTTSVGFSFSQPNFYDGMTFGGIPQFGTCALKGDFESSDCKNLKICVIDGSTYQKALLMTFPVSALVPLQLQDAVLEGIGSGTCNVIAGGMLDTSEDIVRSGGYTGNYTVYTNKLLTKDPLALVTRQSDPEWSSFVYWIMSGLFYADEQGITKDYPSRMPLVFLFGKLYARMFRDAIAAVGSYGDIYAANMQQYIPRQGLNLVNGDPLGPQHYALPGVV